MKKVFVVQGIEKYPGDESMNIKLVNRDNANDLRCADLTLILTNPSTPVTFGDKYTVEITKGE